MQHNFWQIPSASSHSSHLGNPDSEIQEIVLGIRNPGLWNPEYNLRNPTNDGNLSFKWQKSRILDLEFGIYGVESRIRERLNSWIPLYGANRTTIVVKLNLIGWQCDRGFIKSDHRNFAFVRIDHIERLINSYRLHQNTVKFRKYAAGLIFFKGPFWGAYFLGGLYSEWLIYGGKLAFQNRLG